LDRWGLNNIGGRDPEEMDEKGVEGHGVVCSDVVPGGVALLQNEFMEATGCLMHMIHTPSETTNLGMSQAKVLDAIGTTHGTHMSHMTASTWANGCVSCHSWVGVLLQSLLLCCLACRQQQHEELHSRG
jgi:hypothetical protein